MQIGIGIGVTFAGGTGGETSALSALTLAWSAGASTLTIGATSSIDLVKFGAYISEGEGVDPVTGGVWFDGAGAVAGAQELVLTQAALEAELGALPASAVLNVSPGYSQTDPAVTVVLAASSGVYPTPVVYTAAVDDITPTVGALITGSFDMIVGPTGQVISYRYQNVTEGVTNTTTLTYTPDAGDEGDTLQFRVTSTLGALSAYDDSDVTSAVAAASSPVDFDAVTNKAIEFTTVHSFTHTAVDAHTKGVVQIVHANEGTINISSVTYGGASCSLVAPKTQDAFWQFAVYACAGSFASGSQTVEVTLSGDANAQVAAYSFTGGDNVTAVRGTPPTPTSGTGTAASISITSAANDLAFAAIFSDDNTLTYSAASGETERLDTAYSTTLRYGGFTLPGETTASVDVTISGSAWWNMIGCSLKS